MYRLEKLLGVEGVSRYAVRCVFVAIKQHGSLRPCLPGAALGNAKKGLLAFAFAFDSFGKTSVARKQKSASILVRNLQKILPLRRVSATIQSLSLPLERLLPVLPSRLQNQSDAPMVWRTLVCLKVFLLLTCMHVPKRLSSTVLQQQDLATFCFEVDAHDHHGHRNEHQYNEQHTNNYHQQSDTAEMAAQRQDASTLLHAALEPSNSPGEAVRTVRMPSLDTTEQANATQNISSCMCVVSAIHRFATVHWMRESLLDCDRRPIRH